MPSIRATATATPRGDAGRFVEVKLTPAVVAAVTAATEAVFQESQLLVPVRTGFLKSSGRTDIQETGKTVVGSVIYDADYASHVEFIIFSRAGSRAYLRPALDSTRETVKEIFKSQIALALK